ncbi:MAG: hypothetical protein AAFY46_14630, partial [Planctomycetota bacterium]
HADGHADPRLPPQTGAGAMKALLCIITLATLSGCVYNKSPIHLYMRDYEMTRAVNDHFTPGMPSADVKATLESFDIRYRSFPPASAQPDEIEAAIHKAGPRLSTSCCPGAMNFLFQDDALAIILFRHPLPDEPGLLAPAEVIPLEQPIDVRSSGGDAR